jgi:hypothetical protein
VEHQNKKLRVTLSNAIKGWKFKLAGMSFQMPSHKRVGALIFLAVPMVFEELVRSQRAAADINQATKAVAKNRLCGLR